MPYPLTSDAIEATIKNLATMFPTICTATNMPNATNSVGVPARKYSFLKIGKGPGPNRPAVLLVGGHHAREWAQPDAMLTFAGNLLVAYTSGGPFTIPAFTDSGGTVHGPLSIAAPAVKVIVENMDIYMVPIANPDGRAFSMSDRTNKAIRDWRKNRSPLPVPIDPSFIGADLNRNYDIAWDYDVYFSTAAAAEPNFAAHTSKDPARDVYIGPKALSEQETQNIKWLLDNFPISFYVDLHSFSGLVMHSWGIETVQTTESAKNFRNSATWDHKRDGMLGTAYEEFFPNDPPLKLFDRHQTMASLMHDKIKDATGADYTVQAASALYPCTGTSCDYAFSRQFLAAGAPTMYAFVIEFGDASEGFQPTPAQFPKVEREVHAALLGLVSYIAVWKGSVAASEPPLQKECFIATAVYGGAEQPEVRFLREWRDILKSRRRTKPFMQAFETLYYSFSPAVASYLRRHGRSRRLVRASILEPLVVTLRRLFPGIGRDGN